MQKSTFSVVSVAKAVTSFKMMSYREIFCTAIMEIPPDIRQIKDEHPPFGINSMINRSSQIGLGYMTERILNFTEDDR